VKKELKRVSVVVLAMFVALFVSTSVIQVFQADSLAADPRNSRTLYDSYRTERGPILAGETVIAQSVATGDRFAFQREYPAGELYSAVTGYFNPTQGSSGVERAMNDLLSGTSNLQFLDEINRIISGQPPKGAAVQVTVEPAVQQAAFDALGEYTGSVVAIEPSTGRILAMVSKPTYDPNALAGTDSSQVIENYSALLEAEGDPLINRSISGSLNPPGSTFKLVVATAAFESGDYAPETQLPNPASLTLPGTDSTVYNSGGGRCGGGGDTVSISDAIRYSCNIPMAELGIRLGDDVIRETAERYGFNQDVSIPLSVEQSVYPQVLDTPQTGLSSFGQSDVRATPLEMAMVSAGIANDGEMMTPGLIDEVTGRNLEVLQSFEPSVMQTTSSAETADVITQAMVASVSSGAATNATIDGVSVAGKTGTAENGTGDPYTLWFTGFAPADDPQVAVAVVIEDGGGRGQDGSGNALAAPVAKKVLEAVLNG
jgi:peptidoglycan glycosyltransferase